MDGEMGAPQGPFERAADYLLIHGFTSPLMSLTTLALTCVAAILVARDMLLAAGIVFAGELALETVDGLVAQRSRTNARRNLMIDYLVDRLGDVALAVGFGVLFWMEFEKAGFLIIAAGLYAVASLTSTYVRAESARLGLSGGAGGYVERPHRQVVLLGGMLLGGPSYALLIASWLATATTLERLCRTLRGAEKESIADVLDFVTSFELIPHRDRQYEAG